ncbi:hypothetical protein EOD29_24120 [Mesorhizobium sp. M1A.T.Ca.IN.004.03.1.1]|nr:hypothetical protein EOD29_24120 [Mesorhizobium sp. M1A.T.Ca.IN.004.03.1.1]
MARSKMEPSDVPQSHSRPEGRLAPRPHPYGPGRPLPGRRRIRRPARRRARRRRCRNPLRIRSL